MKLIVTHHSPDLDAITSIWLIKRFLPGWEKARVQFVPAGERLEGDSRLPHAANDARRPFKFDEDNKYSSLSERRSPNATRYSDYKSGSAFSSFAGGHPPISKAVIEKIGEDEVIHVDTGLGPLDHHQTPRTDVSATSLTFDFVKRTNNKQLTTNKTKTEAISRMVKVVVELDHFKECLWPQASADYHDFSLHGVMDGLGRILRDNQELQVSFMIKNLDALVAYFENKVWAEEEIKKGIRFQVLGQRGIGFETINDTVLPLAQKLGFAIVIRKDPRKGYVRIKVRPDKKIDLTGLYKKLLEKDPDASWFLHVSKKMLLNGTAKNPKMKPTKLSLEEIIKVLKQI